MEAAKWVEMVRVNPGNYADSKKFAVKEYTDEQYAAELKRIEEKFAPLRQRRAELAANRDYVEGVLRDGATRARAEARKTLTAARRAVGIE